MNFLSVAYRQFANIFFQTNTKLLSGNYTRTPLLECCQQMATLNQMHRSPWRPKIKKKRPTFGLPFLRGIVLKTLIKKPKKPNSANRKCVRVRLSNGREATAYVPGEGHNLQEHSIVLVRGGRLQDVPGVKLKCVRGKYDLAHVKK
ncbi:28S ribosomal protein S12, mitochondrial [Octopus bimaculoides]|uniref:Small ribosomal subunit protein uS12m n=1 Tax=Octopus bimaculoides TaxID=37653 RepID=A0A0L8HSB8_OCTBM|nr:28S ribosomal protein S12, mitochondrial [Octopus bimaculoides]XP_014769820.1 28S ribosomal protein S12, mitochondrial [Octopus bimaculoides]|eukprot:XP_014769819.1 PREDICTED: 28S ribosomal protein S12, mitochondrial-like [Octopus bimaculoides]